MRGLQIAASAVDFEQLHQGLNYKFIFCIES